MMHQRKLLATLIVGASLGMAAASASADTSTFIFTSPSVTGGVGSLNVASNIPVGNVATFTGGSANFSFYAPAGPASWLGASSTPYSYSSSNTYYAGGGYSYCCGWSTCYQPAVYYTDNYYTNSTTDSYSSPVQSAQVTVGGNSASVSAPSSNTGNVSAGTSTSPSAWNGNGYNYFTTYYYTNTTTIGGSFNAMLALDPTALGVLNSTGMIGFNLSTIGNVTLNQVALTVDYTLTPAVAAVPEPETYAMLLAGLGLLGFTARRRKQSA